MYSNLKTNSHHVFMSFIYCLNDPPCCFRCNTVASSSKRWCCFVRRHFTASWTRLIRCSSWPGVSLLIDFSSRSLLRLHVRAAHALDVYWWLMLLQQLLLLRLLLMLLLQLPLPLFTAETILECLGGEKIEEKKHGPD